MVQYSQTNYKNLFNLGFGDEDIGTGEIDDTIVSNNGDSEKVLATVVATLYAFFDRHNDSLVYVTGSSASRTRPYRMGIRKYLEEASSDFVIYRETKGEWEEFEIDKDYQAFLVVRKEENKKKT
jgi:hypothetical protein